VLSDRRRRQRSIGGLTAAVAVTACALAALALAQDSVPITVSVDARVTPNKAGTKRHPQGVKVDVTAHIHIPNDYDPPLVQSVDVWFPKGGLYNGGKFPKCSQNTLARRGLRGCPAGSIMGHGTAMATADTVPTIPKITVVNGGADRVFFYTVLTNPARVQEPVPGIITKVGGGWSYKLHVTIPTSLQVVAGIPIRVSKLHITAGRGDWIATTSCPRDHRWRYHSETLFTTGARIRSDGSVACR
jgi:hypothetical protein